MKHQAFYEAVLKFSNKTKFRSETIVRFCKRTPWVIVGIYISFLLFLIVLHSAKVVLFIGIPLADFLGITLLRQVFNCKRPYEELPITPLIQKKVVGKSFPSRHTASAFIIGMACLYVNVPFGVLVLLMACIVGATRVLVGVHYVRDVVFGALISLLLGVLGFFVLGHFVFTAPILF